MIKVEETDPIGEVDPSFPFREVMISRGTDMKQYYDIQNEIGRGKFGTVYRCQEKSTGLKLAAKFVSIAKSQDRRNAEREVEIMRELQHPRLIQIYDAYEISKVLCVVLELIDGGELFERVIDDDFVLTEKSVTVFMRQICEGVAFMHSKNILHLDMKPENILCLTRTGNRIKIIDFGLARKYDPGKEMQVLFGTPEFVAPEVVNFENIGYGTDMWSVGVICYVLLSGLSPFMGETDVQTMANVTIAQYDFDDEAFNDISDDAKDFISKLLVKNIEDRMSASECLSHCWLQRRSLPVPNPSDATSDALDCSKDNLRQLVDKWSSDDNDTAPLALRKASLNKKKKLKKLLKSNSPTSEGDSKPKGKTKIKKSKSKVKITINNDLSESLENEKKSEVKEKKISANEKLHKLEPNSEVVKTENNVRKITDNEPINKNNSKPNIQRVSTDETIKINKEVSKEREKVNQGVREEKAEVNEEINQEQKTVNREIREEKEKLKQELRQGKEKVNQEIREEKDNKNLESSEADIVTKKSLFIKKITENNITVNRQEISMSKIVKGNSVNNMSKNYEQNINTSQKCQNQNSNKEKSGFSSRMDEEENMLSQRISNLLDENSWYTDQVIRLSERIKNPPKRNSLNDDQISGGKFTNYHFRRPKFRMTSLSRDVPFGIALSSNNQFIDCMSAKNDISSPFWPFHRQSTFHSDPGSPRMSPDRPTGPFTQDVLMRFFDRPFDKKLLSVYSSSSSSLGKNNSSEISS